MEFYWDILNVNDPWQVSVEIDHLMVTTPDFSSKPNVDSFSHSSSRTYRITLFPLGNLPYD